MIRLRVIAAALLALVTQQSARAAEPSVTLSQAWARATPPQASTGGVYVTITVQGAPDRLIDGSTPVAASVSLHRMIMKGDIMEMRPVPALQVEPGQAVTLTPDNYHLMLMGLKQTLTEGFTFPMTLHFSKAGDVTTLVRVGSIGAMNPSSDPVVRKSGTMSIPMHNGTAR